MRARRPLAALALALMTALYATLAACALPQPFQPEAIPKLTLPGVRAGLVVEPFDGAKDPPALAEALADALQGEDVAATTDEIPAAYHLFGRAVPKGDSLEVQWAIEDPRGGEVGGGERLLSATQAMQWRAGDPEFYRGLAKSLATEAAASLAESKAGAKEDYVVVVPVIAGAPGDGPRTLQRSMIYLLEKRGLKVSQTGEAPPDGKALMLLGTMTVTPANGRSHIAMSWALLRDDGSEVGKVDQANDVPPGLLRGQWGDVAYAIADAAAPSIVELVERAAASPQAASPQAPSPQAAAPVPPRP